MSQKTNPLSLRLQKGNHHFSSPWFTDFFFSDTLQYESSIRKYLNKLLEETQYSKAFFSAKSCYRKFNILFSIQDTRAQRKEKQLLFNLKSSSSNIKKHSLKLPLSQTQLALKLKEGAVLKKRSEALDLSHLENNDVSYGIQDNNIKFSLPAEKNKQLFEIKAANFSYSKVMTPILSTKLALGESLLENKSFSNFFRKRVRNNFLKFKQNYNYKDVVPSRQLPGVVAESKSYDTIVYKNKNDFSLSKVLNKKLSFVKATHNYFQDKVKDRNCFTHCEKIVYGKKANYPFLTRNFALTQFKEREDDNNNLVRSYLKKAITHFEPIRFVNTTQSVIALLDQIVVLLEKRVSFREIKSKLFNDVNKNCLIKGVRFSCSGRLGGRSKKAQKAKMQSYQWGETSLNAFSSKVVFANKGAITPYGKVGVKLWLSFF